MDRVAEPLNTDQLLKLYEVAIDEYRFQVRLNWDRTSNQLTLISGLITIGAGLLKFEGTGQTPTSSLFIALIFFVGLLISLIGIASARSGHRYYRNTVIKKTVIEAQLGLNQPIGEGPLTMSVGTTPGQQGHLQILHNPQGWMKRKHRRKSVTGGIIFIFWLFAFANLAGIFGVFYLQQSHAPRRSQHPPFFLPL